MSKYMDFAPRKGAVKKVAAGGVRKPAVTVKPAAKPVVRRPVASKPVAKPAPKHMPKPVPPKPARRPLEREPELGVIEELGVVEVEEKAPAEPKKKSADKMFKMPKPKFINQDKVVKRPLSKNVYRKKAPAPVKEEPKGPVTIITKPEKQAHVSLIVTIILTIILGAAAGTVAFLLLPK